MVSDIMKLVEEITYNNRKVSKNCAATNNEPSAYFLTSHTANLEESAVFLLCFLSVKN